MVSEPKIWGRKIRSGQILAIFIVVLAAIFIMIGITLSLGRMSIRKTSVENAADSTALMLASHLGSYAKLLSDKYVRGGIEVCHFSFSDLFKIIIGIVLLVIAIFVTVCTLGEGAPSIWAVIGVIVSWLAFVVNVTGTTLYFAKTSPGITRTISRQFKKMGRKMQFKEAAVFHALSKVVDDPVLVTDIYDFDEDGKITDTISRFNFWYIKRTKKIAAGYFTEISDIINGLDIDSDGLDAILNTLYEAVDVLRGSLIDATESLQAGELLKNPLSYIALAFPTQLVEDIFQPEEAMDIPTEVYDCLPDGVRDWVDDYQQWQENGSAGSAPVFPLTLDMINDLGDTLTCFGDIYGNYLPTWLIGGYPNEPIHCTDEEKCDGETAQLLDDLFYNDKFDSLIFTLDYFVQWADAFKEDVYDEGLHTMIDTLDFWLPMLYCGSDNLEEGDSCLYHLFEEAQGNVTDIMVVLPIVAVLETFVGNGAAVAEMVAFETELGAALLSLEALQLAVKTIYDELAPWLAFVPTDDKYIWNDSRGWHYVNVFVGGFPVPSVRAYRKGCCTRCIKLSRYESTANVGVSRRDAPSDWNKEKFLGLTDPLDLVDWEKYGLDPETVDDMLADTNMPDYDFDLFSDTDEDRSSTVYFGDDENRPLWNFDEQEHTIASYARASWRFKPMEKIALICTDRDGAGCMAGEFDPGWLK
ncbi:MAG: Tad domain-containing protein [Candidatus Gygaella obscura]|nr:Tad domain-containing protein [Candidatus Gygaella obscura]